MFVLGCSKICWPLHYLKHGFTELASPFYRPDIVPRSMGPDRDWKSLNPSFQKEKDKSRLKAVGYVLLLGELT